MVVVSSLPPPTEGVKHEQPATKAFLNNRELGKGTIYIAESRLSWVDSVTGRGFSLEYPHISIHAVCRDLSSFPEECLYVMLDTNIDFSEERNGEASSPATENADDEDDDDIEPDESKDITELRFAPEDKATLDPMFQALMHCQTLHPDANDSLSGESDDDFDEDYDEDFEDCDDSVNNMSNGFSNMDVEEHQFDPAEDDGFQEN